MKTFSAYYIRQYLKAFTFLMLATLVSGCIKFRGEVSTNDIRGFEKGEKGAVLLRVSSASGDDAEMNPGYTLAKLNDDRRVFIASNYFPGIFPSGKDNYYAKYMLFLEPGIYYIDSVQLEQTITGIYYSLPAPGYKNSTFSYGAFEVEANKVINLGNVEYDYYNNRVKIVREDDKARIQLKAKDYENIAERMEPGKFYMPGSKVIKKEDGSMKILDGDIIREIRDRMREQAIQNIRQKRRGQ